MADVLRNLAAAIVIGGLILAGLFQIPGIEFSNIYGKALVVAISIFVCLLAAAFPSRSGRRY